MALRKRSVVKKFGTKRIAIILVVAIVIISLLRVFILRRSGVLVETTRVKKTLLTEKVDASGRVDADQKVDLTFHTSGTLAFIAVKRGDFVKKGQVIASLDKKQLEFQLKKILNSWEREFTEFDDTQDLIKDEILTDAVRRIKKRAQIDLDQTQLDVEIQNEAIRLATIYAPFSGIITDVNPTSVGVNVTPQTALFTLVDPESVYFEAEVNELELKRIKLAQDVEVSLDAYPDESFKGKVKTVDFVSTTTSTGGTAYNVKVSLPTNDDLKFRIGMRGDASFMVSVSMGVWTIPQSSVFEEDGQSFVWKVQQDVVKKQQVETGISANDDIEITSGLNEADLVVVKPQEDLKEGSRIKS